MSASVLRYLADLEAMTLGELIAQLESLDPEREVEFDFGYMEPTTFASWRGNYAELALGYGPSRFPEKVRVGKLLALCEAADGKIMEGWKGGDYLMTRKTPVWIDNSGDFSSTKLVAVGQQYGEHGAVILVTAKGQVDQTEPHGGA